MVLRELLIDFIWLNRATYEEFVDNENYQCWDDFIDRMRLYGVLGDGILVIASVMWLRRDLIVHQHGQQPLIFKSPCPGLNCKQLHLAYNSNMIHYDSMTSIDSSGFNVNLVECIFA